MRTKQEVRDFLNSQVGQKVNAKAGDFNGQCVSLIKALFEFLGVPNPYAARGHAKDAGDTYLRQGIATNARGWLNVVVNRDMGVIDGVRYGHIWIDLAGEANYEQNGRTALRTTKNTRPISQGQQIINLDKWIKEDEVIELQPPVFNAAFYLQVNPDVAKAGYDAAKHWQEHGIAEGRNSAPNFNVREYVANYADLKAAFGENWKAAIYHYFNHGINEGRFGTKALFDAAQGSKTLQAQVAQLQTELTAEKAKQIAMQANGTFTEADRATLKETNTLIQKIVEWFKAIFKVS